MVRMARFGNLARMRLAATPRSWLIVAACLCAAAAPSVASSQVYRYKDKDGAWVYTDQPPGAPESVESLAVSHGNAPPKITIVPRSADGRIEFVAVNECHCKVEFDVRAGADQAAAQTARAVVDARTEKVMLALPAPAGVGNIPFDFGFVVGEPGATHAPKRPYRLPYATARSFTVTQAAPDSVTHTDPTSYYAVDFAMPIGSEIHAAREGTVINVAYRFHRGGFSPQMLDEANFVQILQDDGTTAIYAHLQLDTVRVRPGQRVRRGEYIANSGNTGFSGGPHLHFAVLRNIGMQTVSVPVTFEGPGGTSITLHTGDSIEAN
jgi:murein DD-endopeptidase MepM/ murein hydrolase activator NlpD